MATVNKITVKKGNSSTSCDIAVKGENVSGTVANATTAEKVLATTASDDTNRHVWFSHSSIETQRVYDDDFKYNPSTNTLTVKNVTGNAATATKLKSSDPVGSSIQPVYFDNGVPVAVEHILEKSVPADAQFTDTTYDWAEEDKAGLMSPYDKEKLNDIDEHATRNDLKPSFNEATGLAVGEFQRLGAEEAIVDKKKIIIPQAISNQLGVVKLSDSYSENKTVSDGVAATPKAVKTVYDLANTTSTNLATFQNTQNQWNTSTTKTVTDINTTIGKMPTFTFDSSTSVLNITTN